MSENTVFNFKIKCGIHTEDVSLSRAICGVIPTTDTLADLITSRTGIPKENQKLIVHGRLIKPESLPIAESLHQFEGRTIILLGCTAATVARIHKSKEDALKRDRSFDQRRVDTQVALAYYHHQILRYSQQRREGLTDPDQEIRRQMEQSEAMRQGGRFFGVYVQDAMPDEQGALLSMFGVGLIPEFVCQSRTQTNEGCVNCCEVFLIEWYAFAHQRLMRATAREQLRYETIPIARHKLEYEQLKSRWKSLELGWNRRDPDLQILLQELQAIEELLDYPDQDKQHLVLYPDKIFVSEDYVSLRMALLLLRSELKRDEGEDDWDEREVRVQRYFAGEISE